MQTVLLLVLSYLVGAIPFAFILTRWFLDIDIREEGSGNVGSTNVLRTAGRQIALASFTGDVLKGVLAAWLGMHFGGEVLAALCSVAAVIGHCWPVYLGFRGGKGVATSAGIILYLFPQGVLISLVVFVIIVAISRYVSLASISVAALLPFLMWVFHKPSAILVMGAIMAALVIFQHRDNIKRLLDGSEMKLGKNTV